MYKITRIVLVVSMALSLSVRAWASLDFSKEVNDVEIRLLPGIVVCRSAWAVNKLYELSAANDRESLLVTYLGYRTSGICRPVLPKDVLMVSYSHCSDADQFSCVGVAVLTGLGMWYAIFFLNR